MNKSSFLGGGVTKQPARGHNSLADGGLGSAPLQRAVGFLRQQHVPQATSKSGNLAITMNKSSSFGSVKDHAGALAAAGGSGAWGHRDIPILSRAEAMASTAVRAADKGEAGEKLLWAQGNASEGAELGESKAVRAADKGEAGEKLLWGRSVRDL